MRIEPSVYYLMDARDRSKVLAVRDRLYSEDRMSGDEMRDAAQTLSAVLDGLIPEEEK